MLKLLSTSIIYYGLANGLRSLTPLLILPILTAMVSVDEYGKLSIFEVTVLLLVPIITLNINTAINVEYFKLTKDDLKLYITNYMLLSFIFFIIIFLSIYISQDILSSFLGLEKYIVILIPFFIILRLLPTIFFGILQITSNPKKFAFYTLIQTIIDLSLSYIFIVYLKEGYIGRIIGVYMSFFIMSGISGWLLFKMDLIGKINFLFTKKILRFSLPLVPHTIGGTILAMSDRYFISYYSTKEEVGLYTISYQISAIMLLVSISVNQAWIPILFNYLKKETVNIAKINKYLFLLYFIFLITAIAIYSMQDLLFNIFVSKDYFKAKKYFVYLLGGFFFQSLYFLTSNFIIYYKKTLLLSFMTVCTSILNIILNYFLIQYYGVIGVAYATLITWIIFFFVTLILKTRFIGR